MLTIYAIPISLYCAKLRILLRQKGLVWQEQAPPGGYGSEEYKQIVPSGNLPALLDGDLLIADSEAIAEYLEERFPNPAALPADISDRAKARDLSRFHDTRLEPELRKLFAHIKPSGRDNAIVKQQTGLINTRLNQLAQLLADWRFGQLDNLLLCHCGYAITFVWLEALTGPLGLEISWPENVIRFRTMMEKMPAISEEVSDYRPKLTAWLIEQVSA